jgi:hypothetical protein
MIASALLLATLALSPPALQNCPKSWAELPRAGEAYTCVDGKTATIRAVATGAPFARWVVLRRHDLAPYQLGGTTAQSTVLVGPDGIERPGLDLATALATGELRPTKLEQVATLVGLSLLGTYEHVWGATPLPEDQLLKQWKHLPPPTMEALGGGRYRLTFYAEQHVMGPGRDSRHSIDQLRISLVPTLNGLAAQAELGRIYEHGSHDGQLYDGWRPDRAPPAAPAPKAAP